MGIEAALLAMIYVMLVIHQQGQQFVLLPFACLLDTARSRSLDMLA